MLELSGLHRRYGEVVALDGLSFEVRPGEVFGFLGPNGAGKTTAMRAVFGLVALDAGEVRWRGEPVGEAQRRRFGYMPEERGLYPGMGVLAQLEFLGRLHDLEAEAAHGAAVQWIDRLGLTDRGGDKLESLSLGNQQRVQLAASLVHSPELLVLDEPFSGLDPVAVDAFSAILTERAAAGATVLFSSHQLDLVEHLCQTVAIIHRGRVVIEGAVADLTRSGTPQLLIEVAGDGLGRWATSVELPGARGVEVGADGTVTVTIAPGDDGQRILDVARRAGAIKSFGFRRRRLSEVFRDALGDDQPLPPELRASTGQRAATGATGEAPR